MTALQIPCPKCGATLKLKDRSLLGRMGKCPKCAHRFVLNEPDEVELELVPAAEEPVRVAQVRRTPEALTPAAALPEPTAAEPAAVPGFAFVETAAAAPGGTSRLQELKRRRSRQRKTQIILGGVLAVVVAGVVGAAMKFGGSQPVAAVAPPERNAAYDAEKQELKAAAQTIVADSPTHGQPITLLYVPAGASAVIHLRPAELWADGSPGQEVVYGLGPLEKWVAQRIEEYALAPPAEVEEITFALLLGSRGSPPEVATVARYKTGRSRSELIRTFGGTVTNVNNVEVFVGPKRAFLFGNETDDRKAPLVVATAPAPLAGDLAESFTQPGLASDAVTRLLERTDRDRHLTLVFQPSDLQVHADALVGVTLLPAWGQVLDRFGTAEGVCWSAHLTREDFVTDLLVRGPSTTGATTVTADETLRQMRRRLDAAPEDLLTAVSKMNPTEVGPRKLIGRFPAMMQVFVAATVGGIDDRLAVLRTRLPDRAGPNLAAAGLLAWDESTRTDFAKTARPGPGTPSKEPPKTLAERLKKPIEIDFRKTPLESAFAYIADETKVPIDIDGDALKDAGYTKNMEQNYQLGDVPAEQAIATMLKKYEKMCVVLDEKAGKAIVTTFVFAERAGQKPMTFAP